MTESVPFDKFKSNLDVMVNPPTSIDAALATENRKAVKSFVKCHFDEVAQGEYLWIPELRDVGCKLSDIANILVDQANDAS
ncbi:hypothetical protein MFIFM68171_07414 [Madurella fahalii]|uniref:Uncharacterized protein n=1 Tax=Madurella fahalii TaxID=1157608 RepID=A0ABQ0GHQ2_9PEZI